MGKANNNPFPSEVVRCFFCVRAMIVLMEITSSEKNRRNAIKCLMERCSRIMSQRKIKKLVKRPVKSGNDFCL